MNKKLFLLPLMVLGLVACGENPDPTPELLNYEGAAISTIADVDAGTNGTAYTIAGYVVAKYNNAYGGIFVANGTKCIQFYGYEGSDTVALPEVGDFVVARGARSSYKNGRVVELCKKYNSAEVEGAGIVKFDLSKYDVASFGVDIAAPVDYEFNAETWATATSSETEADWSSVTGRKVTIQGTVTGTVPTDTANNMTLSVKVGELTVAVYAHKSNDSAETRTLIAGLAADDVVTVTGVVGSYKGATQIICIQNIAKVAA